jgi:hypothetical protein
MSTPKGKSPSMSTPKGKSTRPASYGVGGWRPLVKPQPATHSWWLDRPRAGFTAQAAAHSVAAHTGQTPARPHCPISKFNW